MRHMYYGDPKVVNLDALREDADEVRSGKRNSGAEDVIIHHHLQTEYCPVTEMPDEQSFVVGKEPKHFHEFFPINKEVSNGEA